MTLTFAAEERARQRDLLLVARPRATARAARSTPCGCFKRRTRSSTVSRSRRRLSKPRRPSRPQHLDRRVRAHAQHGEERLPRPVAAQQHHACAERAERRSGVERVPSQVALPVARSTPASARRNWHLPLPSAPAMPEDLALRDSEVDRAEALASQARDGQEHLAVRLRAQCRSGNASWSGRPIISATRLSSDMPGGLERALADAVAQDGDPVGDAEHLRQSMADVDDADPCPALLEHERVEPLRPPPARAPSSARRGAGPSARASRALTTSRSCRSASDSEPAGAVAGTSSPNSSSLSAAHSSMRPYAGCTSPGTAR